MNESTRIITLTTDFGTSDPYVGIMKGVILNINPDAQVVDLTHAIPPQDIHEAAFSIYAAHNYFPKGTIHVIVVDPGVGTDRQAIICKIENTFFVCPDNGVLSYLLRSTENAAEPPVNAAAIQNKAYHLSEVSNTFHGRDIFAPVAAHLSLGVPLADFGPPVQNLIRLPMPIPQTSKGSLIGQIIKIDTFGNAITNISEHALSDFLKAEFSKSAPYVIRTREVSLEKLNRAYADSEIGEPLAIIGSFGFLEIAVNGGSAEALFGLKRGEPVIICQVPKSSQKT